MFNNVVYRFLGNPEEICLECRVQRLKITFKVERNLQSGVFARLNTEIPDGKYHTKSFQN